MTKFEFTRGAPVILSTEIACKRKNEKSFFSNDSTLRKTDFSSFSQACARPPPRFACELVIGFV